MPQPRKIDLVLDGRCVGGDTLFTNPHARKEWAKMYEGRDFTVTFKLLSSMNDKARMFAYINGPLLDATLAAFDNAGIEFANTADIYYWMKKRYARYVWIDPVTGSEEVRVMDFSEKTFTADQLNKFISDWILFMEQEYPSFIPPDSQAYKNQKRYGKGMKVYGQFKKE